jgi:hypothetical protein
MEISCSAWVFGDWWHELQSSWMCHCPPKTWCDFCQQSHCQQLHEYMLCCVLSCMQYRPCTFPLLSAMFCNMSISQSRNLHMEKQISLQNRERKEKKDSCSHI